MRRPHLAWLALLTLVGCQSAASPGASCTSAADCPSTLACRFGRCRTACSADRDCPSGATCLLVDASSGACSVETDVGCETGIGRACASGLVCVVDRCAQTCSLAIGCASGSVCTPTTGAISYCAPAGSIDAAVIDDRPDVGQPDDANASATAPCQSVIDLDAVDAGGGTFLFDTSATPLSGVLPFGACVGASWHVAHQLALSHRMRSTSFLRADSNHAHTPPEYDTIVGLFTSCDAAATSRGCVDDWDDDLRARTTSDTPLTVGTDVIIGIGGLDPPNGANVSSGPLEISVEEVTAVFPPAACDVTGQTSLCGGSGCATVGTGVGQCIVETSEVGDTTHAMPQHLPTTPILLRGGLEAGEDDCFTVDVPLLGGSLVVVPSDGHGECPRWGFGLTLSIFDPSDAMIAQAIGAAGSAACPAIDGTSGGPTHALPAGTYLLCLRATDGFVLDRYDLSVSVL